MWTFEVVGEKKRKIKACFQDAQRMNCSIEDCPAGTDFIYLGREGNRMYLTPEMVEKLLVPLKYFVKHYRLPLFGNYK